MIASLILLIGFIWNWFKDDTPAGTKRHGTEEGCERRETENASETGETIGHLRPQEGHIAGSTDIRPSDLVIHGRATEAKSLETSGDTGCPSIDAEATAESNQHDSFLSAETAGLLVELGGEDGNAGNSFRSVETKSMELNDGDSRRSADIKSGESNADDTVLSAGAKSEDPTGEDLCPPEVDTNKSGVRNTHGLGPSVEAIFREMSEDDSFPQTDTHFGQWNADDHDQASETKSIEYDEDKLCPAVDTKSREKNADTRDPSVETKSEEVGGDGSCPVLRAGEANLGGSGSGSETKSAELNSDDLCPPAHSNTVQSIAKNFGPSVETKSTELQGGVDRCQSIEAAAADKSRGSAAETKSIDENGDELNPPEDSIVPGVYVCRSGPSIEAKSVELDVDDPCPSIDIVITECDADVFDSSIEASGDEVCPPTDAESGERNAIETKLVEISGFDSHPPVDIKMWESNAADSGSTYETSQSGLSEDGICLPADTQAGERNAIETKLVELSGFDSRPPVDIEMSESNVADSGSTHETSQSGLSEDGICPPAATQAGKRNAIETKLVELSGDDFHQITDSNANGTSSDSAARLAEVSVDEICPPSDTKFGKSNEGGSGPSVESKTTEVTGGVFSTSTDRKSQDSSANDSGSVTETQSTEPDRDEFVPQADSTIGGRNVDGSRRSVEMKSVELIEGDSSSTGDANVGKSDAGDSGSTSDRKPIGQDREGQKRRDRKSPEDVPDMGTGRISHTIDPHNHLDANGEVRPHQWWSSNGLQYPDNSEWTYAERGHNIQTADHDTGKITEVEFDVILPGIVGPETDGKFPSVTRAVSLETFRLTERQQLEKEIELISSIWTNRYASSSRAAEVVETYLANGTSHVDDVRANVRASDLAYICDPQNCPNIDNHHQFLLLSAPPRTTAWTKEYESYDPDHRERQTEMKTFCSRVFAPEHPPTFSDAFFFSEVLCHSDIATAIQNFFRRSDGVRATGALHAVIVFFGHEDADCRPSLLAELSDTYLDDIKSLVMDEWRRAVGKRPGQLLPAKVELMFSRSLSYLFEVPIEFDRFRVVEMTRGVVHERTVCFACTSNVELSLRPRSVTGTCG